MGNEGIVTLFFIVKLHFLNCPMHFGKFISNTERFDLLDKIKLHLNPLWLSLICTIFSQKENLKINFFVLKMNYVIILLIGDSFVLHRLGQYELLDSFTRKKKKRWQWEKNVSEDRWERERNGVGEDRYLHTFIHKQILSKITSANLTISLGITKFWLIWLL